MKKTGDNQIYICPECGKQIGGDHVVIRTRRNTELHIHYGCIPGGRKSSAYLGALTAAKEIPGNEIPN